MCQCSAARSPNRLHSLTRKELEDYYFFAKNRLSIANNDQSKEFWLSLQDSLFDELKQRNRSLVDVLSTRSYTPFQGHGRSPS